MKAHFKRVKGKWNVYTDKQDKLPLMMIEGSFWSATVEYKRWLYISTLLTAPRII